MFNPEEELNSPALTHGDEKEERQALKTAPPSDDDTPSSDLEADHSIFDGSVGSVGTDMSSFGGIRTDTDSSDKDTDSSDEDADSSDEDAHDTDNNTPNIMTQSIHLHSRFAFNKIRQTLSTLGLVAPPQDIHGFEPNHYLKPAIAMINLLTQALATAGIAFFSISSIWSLTQVEREGWDPLEETIILNEFARFQSVQIVSVALIANLHLYLQYQLKEAGSHASRALTFLANAVSSLYGLIWPITNGFSVASFAHPIIMAGITDAADSRADSDGVVGISNASAYGVLGACIALGAAVTGVMAYTNYQNQPGCGVQDNPNTYYPQRFDRALVNWCRAPSWEHAKIIAKSLPATVVNFFGAWSTWGDGLFSVLQRTVGTEGEYTFPGLMVFAAASGVAGIASNANPPAERGLTATTFNYLQLFLGLAMLAATYGEDIIAGSEATPAGAHERKLANEATWLGVLALPLVVIFIQLVVNLLTYVCQPKRQIDLELGVNGPTSIQDIEANRELQLSASDQSSAKVDKKTPLAQYLSETRYGSTTLRTTHSSSSPESQKSLSPAFSSASENDAPDSPLSETDKHNLPLDATMPLLPSGFTG